MPTNQAANLPPEVISDVAPDAISRTDASFTRRLQVCYPPGHGRIVLRTESDWERNIEPLTVSADGATSMFEVTSSRPYVYFKPCLHQAHQVLWSAGPNYLLLMAEPDGRTCYPYFSAGAEGSFSSLIEIPSKILGRQHRLRVYLPPGYTENTLATYPVIYMQDGQNLFFPEEAFQGQEWRVDETSQTLRAMRAVDDVIIVGVYNADRMREYTKPGYETYARSLVEELVPAEQRLLRGARDRRKRSVWGSSLGGVVSFYTAWQYPEVFGTACCMSSTFSYQDDLIDRVLSEPRREVGFYLDSGWPGDNYEVTLAMATALISRGWRFGHDLIHLCFPQAAHNESAWGIRLHLPLQFFFGAVARASRLLSPVFSAHAQPAAAVAAQP